MNRLSDFGTATFIEYNYLKRYIDGLPPNIPYILDVDLPEGCMPRRTGIGFVHLGDHYVIYLEERILYAGRDPTLKQFTEQGNYVADTWQALVDYCHALSESDSLPSDADGVDRSPPASVEEDITDFAAIRLPQKETASPSAFEGIRSELRKVIYGQDIAVDSVAFLLANHISKPNPSRPLSLLFYGAPATGKSELAKSIARILSLFSSHSYKAVWTDLNTFTEAHTVHNLTGSPPSYIGSDQNPVFYAVVENPYCIFIWDEIEKAHPKILQLFMGIMDEGRCASNKELPGHTREYDFRHSIHIFTTNSPIGELSSGGKNPIGFISSTDIKEISCENNEVTVEYKPTDNERGMANPELVQKIYEQNEKARRAMVSTGVLPEIATRFSGFVEFKPLDDNAKIRILAKTVLSTSFEYGIKLKYIAPNIIQELVDAAGTDGFSMRSYRAIVEGYLSTAFAATQAVSGGESGQEYRLEGSLLEPVLTAE